MTPGRISFGMALVLALAAPRDVPAQLAVHLTTSDSVALRLAVLHILLDSLGPKPRPMRIWLEARLPRPLDLRHP